MAAERATACAKRGDVDFFKTVDLEILKARSIYEESVLTVAAIYGHLDCCEVIVERCPQLLYHRDYSNKWSVLHWVAAFNRDKNLENIMRFLITADSQPDLEVGGGAKLPNHSLLTMQDNWGSNALHWAVKNRNHGATKLLLEADRDLELLRMVDEGGQTCLHYAAEKGDYEAAELMVKGRPDIEFLKMTERESNQTALHVAAKRGNLEMVKLIWEADPDKQLLSMPDSQGNTPLHLAVENSNLAVPELLLEADHSNDLLAMINSDHQTALHVAVKEGYLEMVKLICEADPDKHLLSMPDSHGNTPLHLAVGNSNLEMVRLCDMVTVYCAVNNDNQTPLSMAMDKAARYGYGSGSAAAVICKVLLENDCTKVVDFHGQNVLHVAAYHGHLAVVQHFLESKDTDVVALLNTQDEDGNTPLHLAVYKGNVEVARLLLKAHPLSEHKATNISTKTPSMMGMRKILSHKYGEWSKSDLELGGGAKIPNKRFLTMQNKFGDTALHLAVTKRNHEVTKLLLEADHGFELLPMVDKHGRTCLHIAAYRGDHESARLIINAKPDDQFLKMTTTHLKQTALDIATLRMLSDKCGEYSKAGSEIVRMLLEKDPKQCIKLVETHKHTFIHAAIKLGLNQVVENILKLKEIEATFLNIQDTDGNTPLHIAAFGQNKRMTLCLLYDERVSKEIENNKKEKAIDLINFPYDEAKARVYSLGHQIDLKDQSSFDLLVAALIATVSFTAGITVPGGYVSDGTNKGSAILLKATAFKVFVISNNFALLFSLYTVFLNFSTRRLLKKDDIYYESKTGTFRARLQRKKDDMFYHFNTATLCTLSAIYAMVVAFITGSYAVLANSDGLAVTVCVCSSFFLILASNATWTMVMQYWCKKVEPEVSA